jgi:uncharacterized protein (TIGR02598 family)
MKLRSPRNTAGFSLVEIAMALGLAAFGMVSLMGVLNLAIQSDDSASLDTRFASMSRHVISEMRSVPFDSLWSESPSANTSAAPNMNMPVDSKFYFDAEGSPLSESEARSGTDALYVCTVRKVPDDYTKNDDETMYNQLRAEMIFRWPARAAESAQKKSAPLYANIARL